MTQIISAITEDFVLFASDRRLTYGTGPNVGKISDDDTCKLVSLCNIWGIGYTGLASLDGQPTDEWIATSLADANCDSSKLAGEVLASKAEHAVGKVPLAVRRHSFVIAGWNGFEGLTGLRPFISTISNSLDDKKRPLETPTTQFDIRIHAMPPSESLRLIVLGQPIRREREEQLDRNLRQIIKREIGPKEAMRLLCDEIINTSTVEKVPSVGAKILGFCIPRRAAEQKIETGQSAMLAALPNENTASFCYFDSGYSELQQYGPTFSCQDSAITDVKTETDASRDYQGAGFRFLRVPKK